MDSPIVHWLSALTNRHLFKNTRTEHPWGDKTDTFWQILQFFTTFDNFDLFWQYRVLHRLLYLVLFCLRLVWFELESLSTPSLTLSSNQTTPDPDLKTTVKRKQVLGSKRKQDPRCMEASLFLLKSHLMDPSCWPRGRGSKAKWWQLLTREDDKKMIKLTIGQGKTVKRVINVLGLGPISVPNIWKFRSSSLSNIS